MPLAVIDVTEKAAQKAKELLNKQGFPNGAIRVKITSGGCSGLSYTMEPTDGPPQKGDNVVEQHGVKVYLDAKSLLYLAGTQLDYEQTLLAQRFKFKNPNATHTCSCGESFTV